MRALAEKERVQGVQSGAGHVHAAGSRGAPNVSQIFTHAARACGRAAREENTCKGTAGRPLRATLVANWSGSSCETLES